MVACFLLKVTVQLWSHKVPTLTNECAIVGKMCAVRAVIGKVGSWNSVVCVDLIGWPLATLTMMGWMVGLPLCVQSK